MLITLCLTVQFNPLTIAKADYKYEQVALKINQHGGD